MNQLLKRQFRPEFLNRLDEIVFYTPLTKEQISDIARLMLGQLEKRLSELHITLSVTDEAMDYLVENGYDPAFGARPLRRFISRTLETAVARLLVRECVPAGSTIEAFMMNGEIEVRSEKQNLIAE